MRKKVQRSPLQRVTQIWVPKKALSDEFFLFEIGEAMIAGGMGSRNLQQLTYDILPFLLRI